MRPCREFSGVLFRSVRSPPMPFCVGVTTPTFFSSIFGGIAQGTGVTPTQQGIGGLLTGGQKPADVLRPQRSKEGETGFDVGLFRDRADGSLTLYSSRTESVILATPLVPSTGYSYPFTNATQ